MVTGGVPDGPQHDDPRSAEHRVFYRSMSVGVERAVQEFGVRLRERQYELAADGYQQLLADRDEQFMELRRENDALRRRAP